MAVTTAVGPQARTERTRYRGPRQCTFLKVRKRKDADANPATVIVSARREPVETAANAEVSGHPAYHSELSSRWEVALSATDETAL